MCAPATLKPAVEEEPTPPSVPSSPGKTDGVVYFMGIAVDINCQTASLSTVSALPAYLAAGGKKDKKGGKDAKKADAKQKSGGKEKDRVHTMHVWIRIKL